MSRRARWARAGVVALALAATALAAGCGYVRLLRPSVLKQLNPRVVRLVNELPATDDVNEALIGRLFAHGGAADARVGRDGVMRVAVDVPPDEYLWSPAVIIMPHGGELEIAFTNPDRVLHGAFLPSDGGRQLIWLPERRGGRARIRLDQPGYYFFGCPVMNHAGRGMIGLILVKGDTPAEARLDRPPQRRP
ncbi:MAG TPA: MSMEG_3727 family PQQ-associated protein [Gemmatimonadaceae bacterium]|nr:MSMEG_3727 family PQQ-associated protein [Gemmatimonadaceae bacterium]